jgi:hypothetical protein
MARIKYETWAPGAEAKSIVAAANQICATYAQQGYDLTLRQLYYQFVARGYIPNNQQSYNKLGTIVNKGRLAGLIDWSYIVDRTRNLEDLSHWDTPSDVIETVTRVFRNEKWRAQPARVEVWVEKEALAGVIQRVAQRWDCPWFSCRGYVSQSELWAAGQRIGQYFKDGQRCVVLHLGDHDPSGIDMTRDIKDRLGNFLTQDWLNNEMDVSSATTSGIWKDIADRCGYEYLPSAWVDDDDKPLEVRRIALNYDQVEQYEPPPNPAKITDSRARGYIAEHGEESWELDALDPATLDALIEEHIDGIVDDDLWHEANEQEREQITLLQATSRRWDEVVQLLSSDA